MLKNVQMQVSVCAASLSPCDSWSATPCSRTPPHKRALEHREQLLAWVKGLYFLLLCRWHANRVQTNGSELKSVIPQDEEEDTLEWKAFVNHKQMEMLLSRRSGFLLFHSINKMWSFSACVGLRYVQLMWKMSLFALNVNIVYLLWHNWRGSEKEINWKFLDLLP